MGRFLLGRTEVEATTHMTTPTRFGILGAARIAPKALVDPVAKITTAMVTRVESRSRTRAQAFAAEHDITGVDQSYAAVISADDVDVVYNPLPMSLHAEWSIAALRAGKHVLCEKPFTSNADEARAVIGAAEKEGLVVAEAFHYRYHPMMQRIIDLVEAGVIGDVTRVDARFAISIAKPDLRWHYETSGDTTMDLGCYPIHWVRDVCGEPTVESATATVEDEIDAELTMQLSFPNGATGQVHSSMVFDGADIGLDITGTTGSIRAINPMAPQNGNVLTITTGLGTGNERTTSGPVDAGTSYDHMVRAFLDHLHHGAPYPTAGADSIANIAVIDAAYVAAGMRRRGEPAR